MQTLSRLSLIPTALFCIARAASLTPLGHLPSEILSSEASAVTPDGAVVVGYSRSGNGFEAFRWTSQGGMVGLGDLPGGEFISEASGVSADGGVVVGTGNSTNTPSGSEAFYWTPSAGMQRLAANLPQGFGGTRAHGVSGNGNVVVGGGVSVANHDEYGSVAFRWTTAGGFELLGDLPGGLEYSAAQAISADGNVVVGSGTLAEGNEAFRWTARTSLVGLGQLTGTPFPVSAAQGVSVDGRFVVGFAFSTNGPLEAFRWSATEGMVALGDLPAPEFRSVGRGISDDGSIIVGEGQKVFGQEASVWRQGTGMQRLWDYLLAMGVDPSADDWTFLFSAAAISGNGRFVVGWGQRNGVGEAFLADLEVRLEAARSPDGSSLRLVWPPGFRLQRTPQLTPEEWTEVTGAFSPLLVPILADKYYYRITSIH